MILTHGRWTRSQGAGHDKLARFGRIDRSNLGSIDFGVVGPKRPSDRQAAELSGLKTRWASLFQATQRLSWADHASRGASVASCPGLMRSGSVGNPSLARSS